MRLYYASDKIVDAGEQPTKRDFPNDNGCCSCTFERNYQVSAEQACLSSEWNQHVVNQYELDMSGLRVLDFLDGTHNIMEWLGTALVHRDLHKVEPSASRAVDFLRDKYRYWNIHDDYDVVIGWRTGDSYFNIAQMFLSNSCDIEGLKNIMSYADMEQVVLIAPDALAHLSDAQYYDVGGDFSTLNKLWRERQDTAKKEVFSIYVRNPEETIAMLMYQHDIADNSEDPYAVEAAKEWIYAFEQNARIERTY